MKLIQNFLKNKPVTNFLLIINMAVSCLLLISIFIMISCVTEVFKPSKGLTESNALYLQTFSYSLNSNMETEAYNKYQDKVKINKTYSADFCYNDVNYLMLSYSKEIADKLNFDLKRGRMPENANEIVVQEGYLKTGENIAANICGKSYDFKVVGLLRKNIYYMRNTSSSTDISLADCFIKSNSSKDGMPIIAITDEEFMQNSDRIFSDRNVILTIEGVSKNEVTEFFGNYGDVVGFDEIKANSLTLLSDTLKFLLPIAIFSIILCFSSSLINIIMIFKLFVADLTILYVGGYPINKIRSVCFIYNIIITFTALIIGLLPSAAINKLLNPAVSNFRLYNYVPAIIYVIIQLIIILINQNKIIQKKELVQVMHRYEE